MNDPMSDGAKTGEGAASQHLEEFYQERAAQLFPSLNAAFNKARDTEERIRKP